LPASDNPAQAIGYACAIFLRNRRKIAQEKFMELKRDNVIGFAVIHALALLALFPWFFSWTGVVLFLVGIYVFGLLGINLGFHRLLTHRGLSCPLWLERTLAILGTLSAQFSPPFWVAVHRRHHHFAEREGDPHSPHLGFFWAHFGWLLARRPAEMKPAALTERYAKDLLRDPLYAMLERRHNWVWLNLFAWAGYYLAGLGIGLLTGETVATASQFGASLVVWGCVLRTVVMWHLTWSVNSVTHIWGYRNYETPDDSRNNYLTGMLTGGEGWHNNHHADPTSARHGHNWWEFDLTWQTVRLLMLLGLAKDVALPSPSLARLAGGSPKLGEPPATS
jgi:fatty-acid desaturase